MSGVPDGQSTIQPPRTLTRPACILVAHTPHCLIALIAGPVSSLVSLTLPPFTLQRFFATQSTLCMSWVLADPSCGTNRYAPPDKTRPNSLAPSPTCAGSSSAPGAHVLASCQSGANSSRHNNAGGGRPHNDLWRGCRPCRVPLASRPVSVRRVGEGLGAFFVMECASCCHPLLNQAFGVDGHASGQFRRNGCGFGCGFFSGRRLGRCP